ncbi:MAG: right-handed parallel beta-helix repeat-containing protein [Cyclobacteriaceae bacterium]|nr:right-handed parallel beta-helix repeat-containing protein [Cyclobacteriaceae bacterium]
MKDISFIIAFLIVMGCSTQETNTRVWQSIEQRLQTQLITINNGDTLDLPEGNFMFTKSLAMEGKSNIVIRGKGIDKTILSFKQQTEGAQGLLVSHGKNIVLQDFSIEDAKGDNLKVSGVVGLTLSRIRSVWADGPKTENGAYALYPVLCKQVLIENCIAMGSSDAGIYVGQSDSVIIRNSKAYWNVAGIESENSRWVEIYENEAYENTGGILVFDLPGLTQYGHSTKVYNNKVYDNNHENFAAKGNIVASIPPGTGFMILATHQLELSKNEIRNNKTIGVGVISYDLVTALNEGEVEQEGSIGGVQTVNNNYLLDTLYNPYPYKIFIHDNTYTNSHWFPALSHDIGKLFFVKSFMSPPDIAYDGIADPKRSNPEFCVEETGDLTVLNLDAANDFKNLTKGLKQFECADVGVNK